MSKYNFQLDMTTKNSTSVIVSMMRKNVEVLEIGAAYGRLTKYLTEHMNCLVDIVEIDLEAGNSAKQYARNAFIGKEQGDVSSNYWFESLQNNKYDYIICADVLEHLFNPEIVLIHLRTLLKDNGSILVSIPNFTHSSVLVNLFNDIFEYNEIGLLDNTHVHFFTYSSFHSLIKKAGFISVKEDATFAATYSTELKTSLSNVSNSVAKVIMDKKYSNVYQYIFELKDIKYVGKQRKYKPLKDNNLDIKENFYIQLYRYNSANNEYDEKQSLKKEVNPFITKQKIVFKLKNIAKKIRIDILNVKNIVYINYIMIDDINIDDYTCNGTKFNSLIIFGNDDPQLEIDLEKYNIMSFEQISIEYSIISFYDKCISTLAENLYRFSDAAIAEKDEAIKTMDAAIAEKDEAIKTMDAAIAEKDEAIKTMDAAIAEKDEAIKTMNAAIAEKDEAIKTMDAAIAEKDEAIKTMDAAIAEKDEAIKTMDAAIAEKDEAIKTMDAAIAEKDEAIKTMIAAIEERDIAIANMNSSINELNGHVVSLNNEIYTKQNHIIELDNAIDKKYAILKSVIKFLKSGN